jgi:hypothetical protein
MDHFATVKANVLIDEVVYRGVPLNPKKMRKLGRARSVRFRTTFLIDDLPL